MTDSRFSEFIPHLPTELKWNVSEQTPNSEKGPTKRLGVFIPLDTLPSLIDYLQKISQIEDRVKSTTIYNRQTKDKETKNGVWLSGSGWDGEYGSYGSINPAALTEEDEKPF